MNNSVKLLNVDLGIYILRISIGVLMLFHGAYKFIHGYDYIREVLSGKGLPQFLWLGVPVMEIIAPILLILGVFTRFSGLAVALAMISAILLARFAAAFTLNEFGGLTIELNLLFLFGGLAIFFTGGGKYALHQPKNEWFK